MDHDAMLTDVRKLKQFRDDLLVLSGGGMTADQMHEMAELKRSGKPYEDFREQVEHDGPRAAADPNEAKKLLELGSRLDQILPQVEECLGLIQGFMIRLGNLEGAVAALQQAKDAPEPANVGGQPVSGALKSETGTEVAGEAQKAPDGSATAV